MAIAGALAAIPACRSSPSDPWTHAGPGGVQIRVPVEDGFGELVDAAWPALFVVGVEAETKETFGGNGVALSPTLMLTVGHLVRGSEGYAVNLNPTKARVVERGGDEERRDTDWAILALDPAPPGLTPPELGLGVEVGDLVMIAAFVVTDELGPDGLNMVTVVRRRARVRSVRRTPDGGSFEVHLRGKASGSGAPVLDAEGRLVGIVSKGLHKEGGPITDLVVTMLPRVAVERVLAGGEPVGAGGEQ